jgi:phosphoribosyl 1,2-cyclic phosphate phosphodiesterase
VRIEILGSGGAGATPRPQCQCANCARARTEGPPYARSGPSVFVHGPDVLIDTPEESASQVDRLDPPRIQAVLYSHWHPDHTQGRRVFEQRNVDWRTWPPELRTGDTTPVYVTEHVAADLRARIGIWEHLEFMASVQRRSISASFPTTRRSSSTGRSSRRSGSPRTRSMPSCSRGTAAC